jgi:hypothetical protein
MQPNYKLNCMVVEFTSFLCYQYVGGFFFFGGFFFYFKKKSNLFNWQKSLVIKDIMY